MLLMLDALSGSGSPVSFALLAAIALLFFYLWIRLLLIFPITVVKGRYDFRQAWKLARGNFWRLVAVWLAVWAPIVVGSLLIEALVMPDPAPLINSGKARTDVIAILDLISSSLLQESISLFLFLIISAAVGVAALSYSYKALSGYGADDVVSPQT